MFFLHSINVLDNIDNIGVLKQKRRNLDIGVLWLKAIARQEVGSNYVFNNFQHPGCRERHAIFFLELSARVHYGFCYRNK